MSGKTWFVGLAAAFAFATAAHAATTNPTSLAFGGQSMGTSAPPQAVTFTNNSGASISIPSITVSAQFSYTTTCPSNLAANASCTITVTFTPAAAAGPVSSTAPVSGNLTITSSGAGSPNIVPLTGTAEKSLVTHYYRSILRRAPDGSGQTFWESEATRMVNLGSNVNETWYSMAGSFYFSPEYSAFNRTNADFVSDLYVTFYNRPPDGAGLSFWTGQMASGMPREVVLVSFMFSTEFVNFAQAIFGSTAARAEVDTVIDFYRGILARLPDSGGFTFWLQQFRTAQCTGPSAVTAQAESISSQYVSSGEYTARARTNAQFVGDLYNAFLRRGGDLSGVQFWIGQLDNASMTRNQVRQQFVASAEFTARVNAIIAQGCLGTLYYLSPTGNNSNTGRSPTAPWKTFAKAFGSMVAGDELILADGTYSIAAGTGVINYQGTNSAQPPSGSSLTSMTTVRAQNPGQVTVGGPLFLGRSTRKDRYIKIQGITFTGGSSEIYNLDWSTIKDCGFSGGFSVGTNDHDQYSDHNLFEDLWVWASGSRIIAINYRSHFNVWRRVVVRGDGCGTPACAGSGNPNVGITVYDSSDISLQNILVVDRVLVSGDEPYGDFAVAQHTPDPQYYYGRNEWLGTMSIRAPDQGYIFEPDSGQTVNPSTTIRNAVAWDGAGGGFNMARAGTTITMENLSANTRGADGIRVAPEMTTGSLRNVLVTGTGRYAINSRFAPTFVNTFFTASQGTFNQTTCSGVCFTTNPRADTPGPSQRYITRIEAGSKLKGAGNGGADIGANVVFRYGADGTRHGDPGYNTLTATPLWPWLNEARIKTQMCATVTRGFCTTGNRLDGVTPVSLTSYIWEYLGNPIPAGIYP